MSINAMQWALRQPLNGCQKFVLFILGYHANEAAQCWPSLETIAKECGISRATAICHINEMSTLGLVSKQHRHDNRGYRRSTRYTLHLDHDVKDHSKKSQRKKSQRRDFENQGQDYNTANVRNSDGNIIESSLEQTREQAYVREAKASPLSISETTQTANVLKVFQHWQNVMRHPRAQLDKKRKGKILEALKLGYEVEELKHAIDGCAKTPFNMGENDNNHLYDDIELILRDAGHIDRFIANFTNPPSSRKKFSNAPKDIMAGVGYE